MEKRQVPPAALRADLRSKIALLEWSDALYDLLTVSIHTYERAAQFVCTPPMIVERFISICLTVADVIRCAQLQVVPSG